MDRAYEKYLYDILDLSTEADDHAGEAPLKVNTKKLYSLLKHSKQDSNGIASLKADGNTFSSEPDKTYALNQQLHYVFSPKSPIRLKSLAQRALQDLRDSGMNLLFQPSPYNTNISDRHRKVIKGSKST